MKPHLSRRLSPVPVRQARRARRAGDPARRGRGRRRRARSRRRADRRRLGRRRLRLHAQPAGAARRPGGRRARTRGQADRGRRERLRLGRPGGALGGQKLLVGLGEVGVAVGYEKMRGDDGKVDGARVGEVLGYFSHPDERAGKVYVFPHLFAEVMAEYMATWGATEEDLARIAVAEYANARHNPDAQMRGVELTLEKALDDRGAEPLYRRRPAAQDLRLLADHRRLRRARSSPPRRGSGAARRRARRRGPPRRLGAGHRSAAQGRPRRAASGGRPRPRCAAPTPWRGSAPPTSTSPRSTTASR